MFILSSTLLMFLACPSPPQQGQKSQQSQQAPQNPPQNPQNAEQPQNGTPKNGPDKGPKDGEQNPPVDGMGGPPPKDGEDAASGQGDMQKGDGTEVAKDEGLDGTPAEQPVQEEPSPVNDSLLIRVERVASKGVKPLHNQDDLASVDHVTFSGTAKCDECEGPLILRAMYFLGAGDVHSENNLVTEKKIEAGEFSILLPKGDKPVALELLVDKNEDGLPSGGEYFAVIEMAGKLIPTEDQKGLGLDSTKRDFFKPAPPPGTVGPQ